MKYTKALVNIIYFEKKDIIITSGDEETESNPGAGDGETDVNYGYLPNGSPCPNIHSGKF